MPKQKKYEAKVSVPIEQKSLDWLEDQVKNGRFASIAHGIRYAVNELMKIDR